MSKNRNRSKFLGAKNGRQYRMMLMSELYPDYWDEGMVFYPKYRPGTRSVYPKLTGWKMRQYRTWKHNRKTQYKQ